MILFYLLLSSVLGFFTLGLKGELYLPLLFLTFIFFILLFGDRVFLVFIKAKEVDARYESLYARLQNLSCLRGVKKVHLYESFRLPANIYIIHPYFSTPVIIVAREFFENGDIAMVESALEKAVVQIRSKKLRFSNIISLLQFSMMAPKYFFEKINLTTVSVIYSYIFLPLEFIKDFVVNSSLKLSGELIDKESDLRVTFYLDRFKENQSSDIIDLSKSFVLYKRPEQGLWGLLLNSYGNTINRFNHERANER